ncbi:MAG: replication protein [Candidatus Omnitrophota bacterium]
MEHRIDMDDGYFPIARNLLLWLAKTKLSSSQRAVIDVILCQTYGFYERKSPNLQYIKKRRTKAKIPFSIFIKHTRLDKFSLCRAIKSLMNLGLIIVDKSCKPYTYSFNVEVAQWTVDIFRMIDKSDNLKLSDTTTVSCQSSQQ